MQTVRLVATVIGVGALALGLVISTAAWGPPWLASVLVVGGVAFMAVGPVMSLAGMRVRRSNLPVAGGVVLALGAVMLLNLVAARHSWRWDVTRTRRFTLSPQTRQVLSQLPTSVEALVFVQAHERPLRDLMREYAAASGKFSFRVVDPDRRPQEAQAYGVRDYGTVILRMGERQERLKDPSEQDLTSALARLMEGRTVTVHFVVGHGERAVGGEDKTGLAKLAEELKRENYAVSERLILRDGLPPVGDVLVLAGPTSALLPGEADSLAAFLSLGGRVLCMLEPYGPSLDEVLGPKGIRPRSDVVVDASGVGMIFGMSEVVPLVARYDEEHPITKRFSTATFFPLCRSLETTSGQGDSLQVVCLAFTGEASWGETGPLTGEKIRMDEGEAGGPLCVVAASWWRCGPEDSAGVEGRLVVTGDVDFASNAYLNVSGNRDLCMNALSWLAERKALMAVRPREGKPSYVTMSAEAARAIFALVVLVMPGLALGGALGVWLRRR